MSSLSDALKAIWGDHPIFDDVPLHYGPPIADESERITYREGVTITYREIDGIPMCMRNLDCAREADHDGLCVLAPVERWVSDEQWQAAAE